MEEVQHKPPTDELNYEVSYHSRFGALVGEGEGDASLVHRDDADDWSLLSPIGHVADDIESCSVTKGALVVPLCHADDTVDAFMPSEDHGLEPIYKKGEEISTSIFIV